MCSREREREGERRRVKRGEEGREVHGNMELGDVGEGGRLRCLQGKADTTISCVCVYMHCWLRPVFWVCLVLWLPFDYCYS